MCQPVCRVGDTVTGVCEASAPGHPRSFTAIWLTGSDISTADGIGIIRVGDTGITDCGHTIQAVSGSEIYDDRGAAIHRVGDVVIVLEGGIGTSVTGSDTHCSE